MTIDKKRLYWIAAGTLAVLLVALFLPESSGRIFAAALLLPLAAITWFTIKKRPILSINSKQILGVMAVMGAVYLALYYITGVEFGYINNTYRTGFANIFKFLLPSAIIIVTTEIIRYVWCAQNNKLVYVLGYVACVLGDIFAKANLQTIGRFSGFMDFLGLTLMPALIANTLYHYLSKRYGMYPNIAYRAIITLYVYILPVTPAMPDPLFVFLNLLIPPAIYLFIDALYEKKRRHALIKKSKFAAPLTALLLVLLTAVVLLISNQFSHGALVIATESMTGELNKGDVAIFEAYDGQKIQEGQVIAFEKDGSTVVHRVVDTQYINGEIRYFTKGDINKDIDTGYVTQNQILGLVKLKLPYIGYPSLWMRSLFTH